MKIKALYEWIHLHPQIYGYSLIKLKCSVEWSVLLPMSLLWVLLVLQLAQNPSQAEPHFIEKTTKGEGVGDSRKRSIVPGVFCNIFLIFKVIFYRLQLSLAFYPFFPIPSKLFSAFHCNFSFNIVFFGQRK